MKAEMMIRLSDLSDLQAGLVASIAEMIHDDQEIEAPSLRHDVHGKPVWTMTKEAAEDAAGYLSVWIDDTTHALHGAGEVEEAKRLLANLTEVIEGVEKSEG